MNNSKIAIDSFSLEEKPEFDRTPWLRQREGELVQIIEAINKVASSGEWKVLKSAIFEGLEESLEKRMRMETEKDELNQPEIHRLQGQLIWAKKYSDFSKLSEFFKIELQGIRKQIK